MRTRQVLDSRSSLPEPGRQSTAGCGPGPAGRVSVPARATPPGAGTASWISSATPVPAVVGYVMPASIVISFDINTRSGDDTSMASLDLLLHPVRLRILRTFLAGRPATTAQLRARLPDIPTA